MMFTIYERACAESELNNEELSLTMKQLGMSDVVNVMDRAKLTYVLKMSLIKDKQSALDNIMKNIDDLTVGSNDIISLAVKTAQDAFRYRQNLELSLLESQLKQITMEIATIKGMTATEFNTKYPT
jgi:hypothetical protein